MAEGKYTIVVNGAQYEVALAELQGSQIRALAAVPADHALLVEEESGDRLLKDDDRLEIAHKEQSLYSKPPTSFGATRSATAWWHE